MGRMPPLCSSLAADGHGEGNVLFILALTTEAMLSWAASLVIPLLLLLLLLLRPTTYYYYYYYYYYCYY